MRRSMSRTPPVHRPRRSATPVRSHRDSRICMTPCTPVDTSPMEHNHALQTSQITAPATTQRNLLHDVEVWASPITAPPPTLAVLPEGPPGDDCALCQQRLVEGSGRNSNRPLWRWPCRCGMQIHLSCMMHMRIRCPAPQCMHCRDPWPGDSADELLQSECHRAGLRIENTWEDLPEQQEPNMLEGMPPRPNNVLVLCCARTSAWDVTVHAREMEWSPNRVFQVNAQGIREQTGWEGEWGCNLCGRTILHNDPLIMGGPAASHAEAICSADGPRTLVVDLVHGSRNWICLPGCTLPFRADGAIQHVEDQAEPPCNGRNYFAAAPPTSNNDSTNSFIYCPLLLHTAGMLEPHAIQRWCDEISWFEPFCLGLSRIVHDINHFVQAYC